MINYVINRLCDYLFFSLLGLLSIKNTWIIKERDLKAAIFLISL